jgi:hypothetical protein
LERGEEEEEWDEEEEGKRVLEALVSEWIMSEFEKILETNRFHMKDLYEFLAERDVPFSRPDVKVLVTKVYRQVCQKRPSTEVKETYVKVLVTKVYRQVYVLREGLRTCQMPS